MNMHLNIQAACRSSDPGRLAFAAQPDGFSVVNACRNFCAIHGFTSNRSVSSAMLAHFFSLLPLSPACRTRGDGLHGAKNGALHLRYLAASVAGVACFERRTGFRAGTPAHVAGIIFGKADFFFRSKGRLAK